jgi:hypothetical protein
LSAARRSQTLILNETPARSHSTLFA